jgi:hypothetical protein
LALAAWRRLNLGFAPSGMQEVSGTIPHASMFFCCFIYRLVVDGSFSHNTRPARNVCSVLCQVRL